MPITARGIRNIFSDGCSLVLRALLREPKRHWTVTDLAQEGVTPMLASMVLAKAEALGYVYRQKAGRKSYSVLTDGKKLLRDWKTIYGFSDNRQVQFMFRGNNFFDYLQPTLEKRKTRFALTLFSASRLISKYVMEPREFLYLDVDLPQAQAILDHIQTQMSLTEMKTGGNIVIAIPFYRQAIFQNIVMKSKLPLVPPLQLLLDLHSYSDPGRQEAGELLSIFKTEKNMTWAKYL